MSRPLAHVLSSGEVIPTFRRAYYPKGTGHPLSSLGRPSVAQHRLNVDLRAQRMRQRFSHPRRHAPPNPLGFSSPQRFPEFSVPRHIREQVGAYILDLRLRCNLSAIRIGPHLRLPIPQDTIYSWESGKAQPWAIYVYRLARLATYTLHQDYLSQLQSQLIPPGL